MLLDFVLLCGAFGMVFNAGWEAEGWMSKVRRAQKLRGASMRRFAPADD